MIAVPGNPLQDVHTLEHVAFVMQGGAVKKDTQNSGTVTQ